MTTHLAWTDTPLGPVLLLAQDDALTGCHFAGQKHFPRLDPAWRNDPAAAPFVAARAWLAAYFQGESTPLPVPLAPRGTPFQQAVWRAMTAVPPGRTATYGDLARALGRPDAARAVGAATGRNPLSLFVPCHRIVGADGSLTGYAGGLERKRALLALEAGRPQFLQHITPVTQGRFDAVRTQVLEAALIL